MIKIIFFFPLIVTDTVKVKYDINQTNTSGFIDVTVIILTRSTTFAMSIIVLMSLLHSIKVILLFLPEEEERKI